MMIVLTTLAVMSTRRDRRKAKEKARAARKAERKQERRSERRAERRSARKAAASNATPQYSGMQIAPGVSSNDVIGSLYDTSGDANSVGTAMLQQMGGVMMASNFANQQAQNTALFNQGLQRDDAQFYTNLNDLSAQRNRGQVYTLGQQALDNDLTRQNQFANAQYGLSLIHISEPTRPY